MSSNSRVSPEPTQPDIELPLVAAPRPVDIHLPMDGAPQRGQVAHRGAFTPTLSQVAAYPMRWREGEHLRTGGSGRSGAAE